MNDKSKLLNETGAFIPYNEQEEADKRLFLTSLLKGEELFYRERQSSAYFRIWLGRKSNKR